MENSSRKRKRRKRHSHIEQIQLILLISITLCSYSRVHDNSQFMCLCASVCEGVCGYVSACVYSFHDTHLVSRAKVLC